MNKISAILIIGLLLVSSIGVTGLTNGSDEIRKIEFKQQLPNYQSMKISSFEKEFLSVELEDISTFISKPGEPNLPKIIRLCRPDEFCRCFWNSRHK